MLSRGCNLFLRFSQKNRVITQIAAKNSTSTTQEDVDTRDPAPYFFNENVQNILKTVTRPEVDKVFRKRLDGAFLEAPEYKFMTDLELEQARQKANETMNKLLQIPPVVKIKEEDTRILSKDIAIQGYSTNKFVFTDITFGVSNKNRIIVVREPNGILRPATNAERSRLNQIYFPIEGREVYPPKMFEMEHLEPVLNRGDYDFILNRVCIQFDPDDAEFHRLTSITYDHIDKEMHYDKLRSTRHFGSMVFYLAWNKRINNLLIENIQTERIEDAALVIQLYYILHPSENENVIQDKDHISLIDHYIKTEAEHARKLDLTFKSYLELENERRKVKENVDKAHGRVTNNDENTKS